MGLPRTTLKRCNCKHPGQDRLHGKQVRVHNRIAAEPRQNSKTNTWRCTVCGTEK